MRWKIVHLAGKSTEHRSVTGLAVNRYSDSFFTTSWEVKTVGSFFLTILTIGSSSPQPNEPHPDEGRVIFTLCSSFSSLEIRTCHMRNSTL